MTDTPKQSEVKKILSARDEGILKDYDAQGSEPDIPALARKYRVTAQTIRNVLSANGIKPVSTAKRGRKSTTDFSPISKLHAKIGGILSLIRADYRLKTGREPSTTAVAAFVGLNRAAYEDILIGRRDLTLSEMQLIAHAAGITLAELVTPR